MQRLAVLVVAAGSLLGAACTNDYDAFLEGSGGAPGSSSVTSGSTADASSSGTLTGSTTSSTSSQSSGAQSSGGGDGGSGNGGNGGSGGGSTADGGGGATSDGGGGTGGEGTTFPGEDPCNMVLALDVDVPDLDDENGQLTDEWGYAETGGPEAEIANETLIVRTSSSGFARGNLFLILDPPESFSDCSISTSVIAFNGAEAQTELEGFLGVFAGSAFLARIRIIDGSPWRRDVVLGDGPGETSVAANEEDGDPPSRIRIRAHDASISFDVGVGTRGWQEIHTMLRTEVGTIDGIAFGGARRSPGGENATTEVILGPLNAGP